MRADGVGDDDIMVNHEQDAIPVGDVKIEDLVTMPQKPVKFVNIQRRVSPVGAEQSEFDASDSLDLCREQTQFAFETNCATEDHGSSNSLSVSVYSFGSIKSFSCALVSWMSLVVGLRDGTVAAKSTGSNGTAAFAFGALIFVTFLMWLNFGSLATYDFTVPRAFPDFR